MPRDKILITGATGFVGGYLCEYLAKTLPETSLFGTVFGGGTNLPDFFSTLPVKLFACNILDKAKVKEILEKVKPQVIFHLAAQSYVKSSWENPEKTLQTNIIGQSNLLETIRELKNQEFDPKIILACSGEEYGLVKDEENPVTETNPLRPLSPYAISKLAQDYMGYQYFANYGLKSIRLRLFHHTGPRREAVFGVSGFCKKIAEIEKGRGNPQIFVRDLDAVRDFTDVRDVCRAYQLAAEKCQAGEVYNVCSGRGFSFQEILDRLLELSTVSKLEYLADPDGKRPNDGGRVIGDPTKFQRVTSWQPEIDLLKQTLKDMLVYWRGKV